MKVDPQLAAAALHQWMTAEVAETTKRYHELAKFTFGISSATVVLVVTGVKLENQVGFQAATIASLLFLFLSFVASAVLLYPRNWTVSKDVELEVELSKTIAASRNWFAGWFAAWALGAIAGLVAIFSA